MEYYESTCGACGHRYKTGIGKTPAQLEEMRKAGKTCPKCGGQAAVGLDHTSPQARGLDDALGGFVRSLVPEPSRETKKDT